MNEAVFAIFLLGGEIKCQKEIVETYKNVLNDCLSVIRNIC